MPDSADGRQLTHIIQSIIAHLNDPHLYKGQDGKVYVGFGKTQYVMQLDLLLPDGLRGLSYDEVKGSTSIRQYFELANMVLISAEAMQASLQSLDMTGVTKANPAKVHLPPFDLDHLRLRGPDGGLLPLRMQALFTVVAAYWEQEPKLGLEAGLVAGLWRRGMPAPEIIRSIATSTGSDGQFVKNTGRHFDIIQVVIDAFFVSQGRPSQSELSQSEASELVSRWLSATRSAALGEKDIANTVLHASDWRRLGLIDTNGKADLDRVRQVAMHVFSEPEVTFDALVAWVDANRTPEKTHTNAVKKNAQALLKKKRKQGRLNRKRGRR